MLKSLRANHKQFKDVVFNEHFNIILANKTEESDDKDSRNGLGKSTLIEIIHYCFGADLTKTQTLKKSELSDWAFELEVQHNQHNFTVQRSTQKPKQVEIEGDTTQFAFPPATDEDGNRIYKTDDWNNVLGNFFFHLPTDLGGTHKPTFRGLFPYFARKSPDAYNDPFTYIRSQKAWQKKVFNSYLLGLSWEYSRDWHRLEEQEDSIKSLKNAQKSGFMDSLLGSVGKLEAEKALLEKESHSKQEELKSFKVHPEYKKIEDEANSLSQAIHRLANENIADKELLTYYKSSIEQEKSAEKVDYEKIYLKAGISLPELVKRELEEVRDFHTAVINNRKVFLKEELNIIQNRIEQRLLEIESLGQKLSTLMQILHSHGALDTYTQLSQRFNQITTKIEKIDARIAEINRIREAEDNLKIEKARLERFARHDYDERRAIREEAITLFNAHSEYMYESPGKLIIDTDGGYNFKIEIARSESEGFGKMKTFCYDLMLAKLFSERDLGPKFLIHDSSIFGDVDERQIAKALQLAEESSKAYNFQYILCMNSGSLPLKEYLPANFDVKKHTVLELHDTPAQKSLLGFRF